MEESQEEASSGQWPGSKVLDCVYHGKTVYSATLSDKDRRPTPSHSFTQLNYFLSWFTKERKTAIIYYQCRFDENKIHFSDDIDQQNIKIKVLQIVLYICPNFFHRYLLSMAHKKNSA